MANTQVAQAAATQRTKASAAALMSGVGGTDPNATGAAPATAKSSLLGP